MERKIDGLTEKENRILSEIMPVFRKLVEKNNSSKIYSKGVSKIFNYPEFENIERAIKEGNYNKKVEEGDPVITQKQREKYIQNYDSTKRKIRHNSKPWGYPIQ